MRLTHKMRETWIKGRKLLYKGIADDEIAKQLGIEPAEWQEIKGVCSGPPLELNDQAKPTESLEPDEIDFGQRYMLDTIERFSELSNSECQSIVNYFNGGTNRFPSAAVDAFVQDL